MDRQTIEREILQRQTCLQKYLEEKGQLEQQIKKLEQLELQYEEVRKEFDRRCQDSLSGLIKIMSMENPIRAVTSYCQEMQTMTQGNLAQQAQEDFQNAHRVVTDKILQMEYRLRILKEQIHNCEVLLQQSRRQLMDLQNQEGSYG